MVLGMNLGLKYTKADSVSASPAIDIGTTVLVSQVLTHEVISRSGS